jgi:hypothetical protein
MTTHLLPCSCSATIEIGPGQAGGTVVCRQCGASVPVPKLRDFRDLEAAPAPRSPSAGRWSWPHASLLVGAMVATLAGVAAAVVGATPRSMLDTGAIQAAVAAADDRSIIMAWKSLSVSGVDRPPTREEQSLLRVARFRRGAATGLMVVGFVGGLMAIGGGIALATTRKESA